VETIAHRELRNNSSAVLARVSSGETLLVTNHGTPAAILVPPARSELARIEEAGRSRPPRVARPDFSAVPRVSGVVSRVVLDDLRGDR